MATVSETIPELTRERALRALPRDGPDPPDRGGAGARPTPPAWSTAPATPTSARRRSPSASAPTCGRTTSVFSTHRGHGHALAKGVPPRELIAELFGRATGCSRGRGGSMHLFAPEIGLMGTSGIVGPCILQAAGAGYSFRLLEDRPRRRRVLRRRGGQQRRLPRGAEPGRHLEAAGAVRLREQPVRHRGAVRLRRPATRTSRPAAPPTACPAFASTATTCWRSTRRPARRCGGRGPATGRRCSSARPTAPGPHAEGMGDFTYRTREEVEAVEGALPDRRAARGRLLDGGVAATEAELDRDRRRGASARGRGRPAFAEASPWPDPATATARTSTRSRGRAASRDARADVHRGDARRR